jgi:hypothetical protein
VTITAGQTIAASAHVSPHQGATNTGAAFWAVCQSAHGATTPVSPNSSWIGGKYPVNSTANVSVHDVFTGLAAGSYDIGICAWLTTPAEWSPAAPGYNTYAVILTQVF